MTNDTLTRLGIAMVLVAACDMPEDPRRFQNWATTDCHLMDTTTTHYGRPYGMTSGCVATPAPAGSTPQSAGKDAAAGAASAAAAKPTSSAPAAPPAAAPATNPGAAPLPDDKRYSAFDAACVRDSQCGPGKCMDGDCYYGCQTDAECGSGDRCSVESGARICQPDPNPPVSCTRNAQCAEASVCLNGSCRQTCASTDDCTNLLDRCLEGICQPDRRPLVECVLNSECGAGLVCLDGACVEPCREGPDAGPCPNGSAAKGAQPATGAAPHASAAAPAAASSAAEAPTTAAPAPAAPAAAAPPAEPPSSVGPTLPELPPGGNLFDPAPEGPDAGVTTDTSGASPEIR